jgi:hypothetical protein
MQSPLEPPERHWLGRDFARRVPRVIITRALKVDGAPDFPRRAGCSGSSNLRMASASQ